MVLAHPRTPSSTRDIAQLQVLQRDIEELKRTAESEEKERRRRVEEDERQRQMLEDLRRCHRESINAAKQRGIFASYHQRWKDLQATAELVFSDLPLPVLPGKQEDGVAGGAINMALTKEDVESFYSQMSSCCQRPMKQVLQAELLKWHPDKFAVTVAKLQTLDQERAEAIAKMITRCILGMKSSIVS